MAEEEEDDDSLLKFDKDESIDTVINKLKEVANNASNNKSQIITSIHFTHQRYVLDENVMKTLQNLILETINKKQRKWKTIKFDAYYKLMKNDKSSVKKQQKKDISTFKGRIPSLIKYLHMNYDGSENDFNANTDIDMDGNTQTNIGIYMGEEYTETIVNCIITFK